MIPPLSRKSFARLLWDRLTIVGQDLCVASACAPRHEGPHTTYLLASAGPVEILVSSTCRVVFRRNGESVEYDLGPDKGLVSSALFDLWWAEYESKGESGKVNMAWSLFGDLQSPSLLACSGPLSVSLGQGIRESLP